MFYSVENCQIATNEDIFRSLSVTTNSLRDVEKCHKQNVSMVVVAMSGVTMIAECSILLCRRRIELATSRKVHNKCGKVFIISQRAD